MEFLENRRSWENQKPPENRQKSGLFWASPFTMHLVCTLLIQINSVIILCVMVIPSVGACQGTMQSLQFQARKKARLEQPSLPPSSAAVAAAVAAAAAPQHSNAGAAGESQGTNLESLNGGFANGGLRYSSTSVHDCLKLSSFCDENSLCERPRKCTIAHDCA